MAATMAAPWGPPTGRRTETRPYVVETFRAMASPCRIVTDDAELAHRAVSMVHDLERRWSRFLAASEISALNRAGGAMCIVSAPTFELVRRAQLARERTDGWFNPLVHDRLVALGYGGAPTHEALAAAAVCQDPIELLPEVRGVRLPPGTRFDPGGIGKGFAADMVIDHLMAEGASAAQVELGGDVRVDGPHWTGGSWRVDIRSPHDTGTTFAHADLAGGAVATSGVTRMRWRCHGTTAHHLIDPFTGMPADNDVAQVTAVAAELWWAEVVAKVALLRGGSAASEVLREHGATGAVVLQDGTWEAVSTTSWTGRGGRA